MIEFTVPLPPRTLSSNGSHGHWSKKSAATKAYRRDVGLDAVPPLRALKDAQRVRLSMTFCIKGARGKFYQPRDEANALSAFKAGIDGLVDAGLCPDDNRKHLEIGAVRIDSTAGPFVRCSVEVLA